MPLIAIHFISLFYIFTDSSSFFIVHILFIILLLCIACFHRKGIQKMGDKYDHIIFHDAQK